MKSTDFAYWLQGFFELSHLTEAPRPLELVLQKNHYECIQDHINLVKTYEGEKVLPFVHWLEGFIAGYLVSSTTDDSNTGYKQAVNTTKEIQTRLGNLFAHEIDPSYGKEKEKQEALNKAHNGPEVRPHRPHSGGSSGITYRC